MLTSRQNWEISHIENPHDGVNILGSVCDTAMSVCLVSRSNELNTTSFICKESFIGSSCETTEECLEVSHTKPEFRHRHVKYSNCKNTNVLVWRKSEGINIASFD